MRKKMLLGLLLVIAMCALFVVTASAAEQQVGTGVVTASGGLRLRESPSTDAPVLTVLEYGAEVTVTGEKDGWYSILRDETGGFASSEYIELSDEASTLAGFVNASALNVRSEPSTSGAIVSKLSHGEAVTILASSDGWYSITSGSVQGYVSGEYITFGEFTGEAVRTKERTVTVGVVNAGPLNVRTGPATSYDIAGQLTEGSSVTVLDTKDGWYAIAYAGQTCYISSEYVTLGSQEIEGASDEASRIISYALTYLGCEYVYATAGPTTFDCSGFTSYVYKNFGYSINRSAADQTLNGVAVDFENMQPGDLVFFNKTSGGSITHVGLYIGNGEFIHASTTGDYVKISKFVEEYHSYYLEHFACARRIIGVE